jgi:hypothetical protein
MALKHVNGRVITKVDPQQKNQWTFSDGSTIVYERDWNNLDRKHTAQVLGICVDGEYIPEDAFILFHHNSVHETYEIFNHSKLSGEEIASGIKMYSIMERDIFFWKAKGDSQWHPTRNHATALRVFQPYEGILQNIDPTLIKNVLYVTSGELEGQVVKTLKACDYQITFRDPETGRDKDLIRFRPMGDEEENREPEAIAILNELTEKVNNGELLIGISISDCKPLKELSTA